MRVCMVMEGSYPYVRGGVSSWAHDLIGSMPEHEFVLWVIGASEEIRGRFRYDLPNNVAEVREVILDDPLRLRARSRRSQACSREEIGQLQRLIRAEQPDWDVLFHCFHKKGFNAAAFLASEQFLELLKGVCRERYPYASFGKLFYTVRSILMPLLHLMGGEISEADVYHASAAGYGSVLGALGSWKHGRPFVLTEHGIYTREREEEILRSRWVEPEFRNLWISFFRLLSQCAYDRAAAVTSLFARAQATQEELGCDKRKCRVIRNGILPELYERVSLKKPDGFVDIGLIARVVPIKDVKTLLYAFAELQQQMPQARLHILGDLSEEPYSRECMDLARSLSLSNVHFLGETDVLKYLEKLDFTVLSSISEGQPLAVLESLAARRPCVVTNVGSCREIVEGSRDDPFGAAGLCVPPMHRKALAEAMARLCQDRELRLAMGEAGRNRVLRYYNRRDMVREYNNLYEEALKAWQVSGSN